MIVIETFELRDIIFYFFKENDKEHYEAVKGNYTGHGKSKIEAYLDLRNKMKTIKTQPLN